MVLFHIFSDRTLSKFLFCILMFKHLTPIVLTLIALISLLMHLNHFPKDIMGAHVWRQTQTQTNIINFYEEDFNIFNQRDRNYPVRLMVG